MKRITKSILALGFTATGLLSISAMAADAAAGKAKSVVCAACHGTNGIAQIPMYPNLAGQKEQYLVLQLKAFRDGQRKNPVMAPMAASLSDADIANLSAYYSQLPASGK